MRGFSHVTLNVSNLEQSLQFYTGTLGMKLVHQGRRDAYLEWGTAWICATDEGWDSVAYLINESIVVCAPMSRLLSSS